MPFVQHGVEGRVGALEAVIRRDQHDLALALHDGDGVETASPEAHAPVFASEDRARLHGRPDPQLFLQQLAGLVSIHGGGLLS